MLELPDDSEIEAVNKDALSRVNSVADMDSFDNDLEGMLSSMDDLIETGVEGLDRGLSKAAIFGLMCQHFRNADPQTVAMMLAAMLTDASAELFIAELTYELEEDTEDE